jgi:predicted amino acid-binding ACT domain protein
VLSQAAKKSGCRITERLERNLAGFHALLAVIDPQSCGNDFEQLRRNFSDTGNAAGVRVILQTEDALKSRSGE